MCCSSLIHRKHVRNEHRRRISWFLFPSSTQKWPCRDFFAKWKWIMEKIRETNFMIAKRK